MLQRLRERLFGAPREMTPAENHAAMAEIERAVRAVVTDPGVLAHLPEMLRASSTPQELIAELYDALEADDYAAVAAWSDIPGKGETTARER